MRIWDRVYCISDWRQKSVHRNFILYKNLEGACLPLRNCSQSRGPNRRNQARLDSQGWKLDTASDPYLANKTWSRGQSNLHRNQDRLGRLTGARTTHLRSSATTRRRTTLPPGWGPSITHVYMKVAQSSYCVNGSTYSEFQSVLHSHTFSLLAGGAVGQAMRGRSSPGTTPPGGRVACPCHRGSCPRPWRTGP